MVIDFLGDAKVLGVNFDVRIKFIRVTALESDIVPPYVDSSC